MKTRNLVISHAVIALSTLMLIPRLSAAASPVTIEISEARVVVTEDGVGGEAEAGFYGSAGIGSMAATEVVFYGPTGDPVGWLPLTMDYSMAGLGAGFRFGVNFGGHIGFHSDSLDGKALSDIAGRYTGPSGTGAFVATVTSFTAWNRSSIRLGGSSISLGFSASLAAERIWINVVTSKQALLDEIELTKKKRKNMAFMSPEAMSSPEYTELGNRLAFYRLVARQGFENIYLRAVNRR